LTGPAYRIATPRLVLRCWDPADSPLLSAAIVQSLEHLRPWMPWAHEEPKAPEDRVKLLRKFRANFDSDIDFVYGIFDAGERDVIGGTGLHTRIGEGAREIGYWIRADQLGQGYATEATAALVRVAFEVDEVRRVEVRCDPDNRASSRVPQKLGFTHEGTLRGHARDVTGEPRDTMIWSLIRAEYDGSVCASVDAAAFDVTGKRLF
jgi:RimJ/RimL family protein N-acetyltransferase